MTLLQRLDRSTLEAEIERPDPEKVVSGDPVHTTWMAEATDGLYAGYWQSTPGKWQCAYAEWEYIHFLEGVAVMTDTEGNAQRFEAGDSFLVRPGFTGTWEVLETVLKEFVIRE